VRRCGLREVIRENKKEQVTLFWSYEKGGGWWSVEVGEVNGSARKKEGLEGDNEAEFGDIRSE